MCHNHRHVIFEAKMKFRPKMGSIKILAVSVSLELIISFIEMFHVVFLEWSSNLFHEWIIWNVVTNKTFLYQCFNYPMVVKYKTKCDTHLLIFVYEKKKTDITAWWSRMHKKNMSKFFWQNFMSQRWQKKRIILFVCFLQHQTNWPVWKRTKHIFSRNYYNSSTDLWIKWTPDFPFVENVSFLQKNFITYFF